MGIERFYKPIDAASVAVYRMLFGLLMLVAVLRFFVHGWIHEYFLIPHYFFKYYGFSWVQPWPGNGMYIHFALMGVFAFFIIIGFYYRFSILAFGVLFAYAHLIDKTNYLNHYYLVVCLCFLMACLPLNCLWSVDALRKPSLKNSVVPTFVLWALRAQVSLVYIFGGIAKLKSDWLLKAQPLKIWLYANSDFPVIGTLFTKTWFAYLFSYLGAGFDLAIVLLLLFKRTRLFAYVTIVVFHVLTIRLFQLGMFPFIMMASSLLFLAPSWPRKFLPLPQATFSSVTSAKRWPIILLGIYFIFHIFMPFRHLLYPGNMYWTEQGFRFSWNVMLMEKNGSAIFYVTDPKTGQRFTVMPSDYLTRYQTKMMASQPDMILQFAHSLAEDFQARGIVNPEVRVDAVASLNGRRYARLIDERVDLVKEHDSLWPKPWILPLVEE